MVLVDNIMITQSHIETAKKIARYSRVKKARVAAIAFTKHGDIITTAYNRRLDGYTIRWSDHAEESLIKKLKKLQAFKRYCKIYILVLRITAHGISTAKPCYRCQKQLDKHNVNVFYSCWSGKIMSTN